MSPRLAILLVLLCYVLASIAALGIENPAEPPDYSRIEEGLYQGGYVTEPPPGTEAVLNLCEIPDSYQVAAARHEPITDSSPAPSLDWLREQVDFIDDQRKLGHTVYVHCRHGVSRSGLVVTAYEMFRRGWTRDQALAFVRSKRPDTRPNRVFLELLDAWEQHLAERNEVTPSPVSP